MTLATLNDLFFDAIERHSALPAALRYKRDGRWQGISHGELHDRVHAVHAALRESGINAGDRVAIVSENRPEWAITDYGCLTARCIDVPIYPTLPPEQMAYMLEDSGCRMAFCSTAAQLEKLLSIRDRLPQLGRIVVFDTAAATGSGICSFESFEAEGRAAAGRYGDWRQIAGAAEADDLATIIYTSGTTGSPKGAMLTHGNITSNVVASMQVMGLEHGDTCLSFLPLSHIFERMAGHYTMLSGGVVINYASSIEAVAEEMVEVRPTIMMSTPRLYEKIYARVIANANAGSGLKRSIFEWAVATGEKHLEYTLAQQEPPLALSLARAVADRLVFRKLRARTGGRLRYFFSGGAPLSKDICYFFLAAGLPILEGYGLTETSPVITVNPLERIKPGTVGPPIPGVEIRIADDGEILTRGPHVMKGYYNLPEETAAAIDPDGWFHTGDIGEIDADGYLRITDRKKDLIVTAGGKNIAPQPIEALMKINPLFTNAVMIGDRRRFPAMLLVPNFPVVAEWAASRGLGKLSGEELAANPQVAEMLEREARKALRNLAQFEMPKKFLILPRDFSIEGGELTPKMSVRRRVVEEIYAREIEALYAE